MSMKVKACVIAALTVVSAPAFACNGPKTLFTDNFREVDASWGLDSPDVSVEDGKVKVKAQPDISNLLIYKGLLFSDADFCLSSRMPNVVANSDNTMAGPIFWAQDYDNYYMFMITPSGYAEITRKVQGKWIDVIPWRQDTNIKRAAGSTNVLEVQTRGDSITTFINGAKFQTVKGQVPEGGGQIGMRAQSEKDQVDTWKFSNLKVTDLPPVDASAATNPPTPVAAPTPAAVTTPAAPAPATTPTPAQ
ncbi:hypothetical protein [Lichenihabitans psoromatis]|uniref:hypothetical protein n=1 Tax=Lichenihabitans psoromatis TaxID=2528642 RepID=UPI00103858AC|nr:hypothetical protein [Lichenihabitans psoromatis]